MAPYIQLKIMRHPYISPSPPPTFIMVGRQNAPRIEIVSGKKMVANAPKLRAPYSPGYKPPWLGVQAPIMKLSNFEK